MSETDARAGAPALVPLNLIFDYPVRWSRFKVLRDLLQNFYDAVGHSRWHSHFSWQWSEEQQQLLLRAAEVGFSYDWLLHIGASTKRERAGEFAGYFGEGFKIAALCALRDHGWQVTMASRDWHLEVTTIDTVVDDRRLRSLAYRVRQGLPVRDDTVLWLSPFDESELATLECALLSFYHAENPLLGECLWSTAGGAVWTRSDVPKPQGYPSTYDDRGPGIVFAGYQALGSFGLPLVFCAHHYRHDDRERSTFYRMDVLKVVHDTVARLPPQPAAAVLTCLKRLWYRYPDKQYDFDSWYPVVGTLARRIATSAEQAAQWRAAHPHLLVAPPVRRKDLRAFNRRRQALDWLHGQPRRYRLVQDGFSTLGYPTLESVCEAAGGFSVTRAPHPGAEQRLIELLERTVRALFDNFFGEQRLPRCEIIRDERAVWMGMAVCVSQAAVRNDAGLNIRFELPYVALKGSLLGPGCAGEALSTYIHELAHMFGGDRSAAFSAALTQLFERLLPRHRVIADFEREWEAVCADVSAGAVEKSGG